MFNLLWAKRKLFLGEPVLSADAMDFRSSIKKAVGFYVKKKGRSSFVRNPAPEIAMNVTLLEH